MENNIVLREIIYGSDAYKLELELRDKVLRKPQGKSIYDDGDLEDECNYFHVGGFIEERLISTIYYMDKGNQTAQVRQVVVDPDFQGQDVGKKMYLYIEKIMLERGFIHFKLDSRVSAMGFYAKFGYQPVGEDYISNDVPHHKMVKEV